MGQNVRFKDKDKMLIKQWSWPEAFDQPIDLGCVQLDVLLPWIERRC